MPFRAGLDPDALAPRVGDLRQLASVRRITLDDGTERGLRALAFSTGGGLDFWALADRALDIGPLWHRGTPLAWQGANGFRAPSLHDSEADGGTGFNRSLSGLLVTCGLDHVRQPRDGHPLHGRLPLTPARITAYGEDWRRETPILFCEGEVTQSRFGGEALRLHRRIEAPIGGATLTITDRVESLAAAPQPHAILYHFNLGFPAIDSGTTVRLNGDVVDGPLPGPSADAAPDVACHPAGAGGTAAGASGTATCTVETPSPDGALMTTLAFSAETLPWLQVWRDLGLHRNILGIEPASCDRAPDGTSLPAPPLAGRAARAYTLTLAFARDA